MVEKNIESAVTFYALEWDTEFFGVNCAKAILHEAITIEQWKELIDKFNDYQFISIENRHSEPINTQLIGKDTDAFLADVNIQFVKKLEVASYQSPKITVHEGLEFNEQILQLADFQFSKFLEDPELAKRNGDKVYRQWLLNSFEKKGKFYALSVNEDGEINGFLLHSYTSEACVIELIAVSKNSAQSGVGTKLFKSVETSALKRGHKQIKVGTQMRNLGAINFYHKVGCRQIGCHQIYHLWNH